MDDGIEKYGKFIILSDDMKEMIKNMSELELDFYSNYLADFLNQTYFEIKKESQKTQ